MLRKIMYVVLVLFLFCLLSTKAQAELVSEWRFDGNAEDSKGNNHGTLHGNPTWTTNKYGDPGKALTFDGVDDYVDCGRDEKLSGMSSLSVEGWFKTGITISDGSNPLALPLISKVSDSYSLYLSQFSSRLYFFVWNETTEAHAVSNSSTWTAGEWHHVVGTYDGSTIILYIDGVKQRTTGSLSGNVKITAGYLRIGQSFNGTIDEIRIYNHALSPKKIKALYNIHFGGVTASKFPDNIHSLTERQTTNVERVNTPRKITVHRLSVVPVIDGSLSDKVWKDATWYSDFHTFGDLQQIAKPKTSFAMVHDDENLYIGVQADEPEPAKMKALVTKRDGRVWTDDSIEIFLDSKGECMYHYQFVVNTKGVLYDSQAARGGRFHKSEWNSDAKVATRVGIDAWSLEVSIPFSSLSFSPDNLTTWRVNITRSRFAASKKGELFTYAPVQGTFHDTRNFALAQIKDIDLSPFLLDLSLETIKGFSQQGQIVSKAKLLIENTSSLPRRVNLKATLNAGKKEVNTVLPAITFARGIHHQDITIPIPARGEGMLTVSLQDIESQKVVCRHQFSVILDYTPLKVEILHPAYQNLIFTGQRLKDIELAVITAMAPEDRQEYIFEFLLSSDKEILRHQTKIKDEKTIVSVPLPSLKAGKYQMEGKLIHQPSSNVTAKWQDVLRKLTPKKGEVRFDENMVCLIDNKPFLPFGIYGDEWPRGIWTATELGFNTMVDMKMDWAYLIENNSKCLDELYQSGLKIVMPPRPPGFRRENLEKMLTTEQEKLIRSYIQKRKHCPAMLAWYPVDEPQPNKVSLERMKQIHDIIREEDPYHPTLIVHHNIENIKYYADAVDLIMPDPYPGFLRNGGWQNPQFPTHSVKESVKVSRRLKPVWVVLQAFGWNTFGNSDQRAPDFIELRNQMYQAAIAEAKGFFWYCRYWIEPHVKIGLSYLAKEAQLLREAIFAPESPHKFTAVNAKDAGKYQDLHLSSRQVGKDFYLFTVSSSDKKREITFNLTALKNRDLFVVGEAREVKMRAGQFTDSFQPFDTHIYTSNKSVAYQVGITTVRKEIESTCSPIIKSGNLAHKSRGTAVKVSSEWFIRFGFPRPLPECIIDGIKGTLWYGEAKQPSWIEIIFAKPERIHKVIIDSNICHLGVEVEKNGVWKKVGYLKTDKQNPRRDVQTVEFPLVETKKLRLQPLAVKGGKMVEGKVVEIWEIEVYDDEM